MINEVDTELGTVLVDETRLEIRRMWLADGKVTIRADGRWHGATLRAAKLSGLIVFCPDGTELRSDPRLPITVSTNVSEIHDGDSLSLDLGLWFLPE